ncbi:hypothetical protein [Streptomyces cahuitamycinicus]|uniref:Uncharacterized protein n=1 Tax=Streptomyces cahuitamycinicus TaxID=2070367 RepID=A0A2N8TLU1_9ACTN|nr:hypothetical protein C1J00_22730 [Streptomyces cahuitamycinicus]
MVRLGRVLRRRGQAARAATLRLFAGGSRRERNRRPGEPSVHDDDLRATAYQLTDAVGLQRCRPAGG